MSDNTEPQYPIPLRLSELIESRASDVPDDRVGEYVEWWQKELEGAPAIHDLPTDFSRSSTQTFDVERLPLNWGTDLTEKLRELGEKHDISLMMVVLSGYAALVRRYTEQEVVVLGVPTLAHEGDGVEEGLFRDILPIRFDFSESVTFDQLLEQAREKSLASTEHSVPFEDLVRELDIERSESYNPIVQLLFGPQAEELKEMTLEDLDIENQTAIFDLSIFCQETDEGLEGYATYSSDLFEEDTVDRLLKHLKNLLSEGAKAPSAKLNALSLPTEKERRLILDEWNDTDIPVDLETSFPEVFERQVNETPNKTAVVQPGGKELTYRELDDRANKVANYLLEYGVEGEDIVAVCVERGLDLAIGILGILKSGAAYIPLNPTFPEERINFILDERTPSVAVTQSDLEHIFDDTDTNLMRLDADSSAIAEVSTERPNVDIDRHDLAYMVYTSGSTGKPKGPMIEHQNVTNLAATLGDAFQVDSDDRVSQFVSETFDATIWEFAMTFKKGATLVLLPHEHSLLGIELGRFLRDQEITVAPMPPAVVPDIPPQMADGVETMIVAGEACPASVVDNWAPGRTFINGYGPRETTGYATTAICEPTGEAPPIGKPLGNYKTYVLDDNQELAPIGVYGELYIGGPGVGRGYYERPELNAEKFIEDPFSDKENARMYKTGDIVRWRSDGQLEFLGRRDFQVQLRGFRVELGAIEERLRNHDALQSAVTTKHEDDNGQERLVSYVVAEPDDYRDSLPSELEKMLSEDLPDYMVPSRIMVLDEFPLNTTGKVDRHALPEPNFAPASADRDIEAPEGEIEAKLAEGWEDLLGLSKVGRSENFFNIGGTSLMIAQAVYQIKEIFEVELPMRAFFDEPTVSEIAKLIEEAKDPEKQVSQLCFNPMLDLEEESKLDESITGEAPLVDQPTAPQNPLLTGATGFVGAHLLAELLEETDARINCLIRGRDEEHLKERLDEAFDYYKLDHDLLDFDNRIALFTGDLTEKRLGLDDETYDKLADSVDAIYHNGAKVDQVRGYDNMRGPNVGGTERMLRFASTHKTKPFHYVSTTGSVHYPEFNAEGVVPEKAESGPLGKLPNGYMQTKCVGEHLVQKASDRGIPTSIYRLGAVSGHTETGMYEADDYTYSIIRTAVDLGLAYNLNPNLMITPVDFVARSIVTMSRWKEGLDRTYHVTHLEPSWSLDLIEKLRQMGYSIEVNAFDEFIDKMTEKARDGVDTPLLRFLPYLSQRVPGEPNYKAEDYYIPVEWDCTNLETGFEEVNVDMELPSIDELIDLYVENLIDDGYIEPPR